MSNRYSSLNRRPGAATSSLFADYPGSRPSSSASQSRTPGSYAYSDAARPSSPYYSQQNNSAPNIHSSTPYKSSPSLLPTHEPPKRDNFTSTAVLDHLEAQNENAQTSLLSSKVSQLKQLSMAIGDEIRDSSNLAQSMNDIFDNTSVRLKGTMKRMLRMAERTGVGWKMWLLFFAMVWLIFVYIWLF